MLTVEARNGSPLSRASCPFAADCSAWPQPDEQRRAEQDRLEGAVRPGRGDRRGRDRQRDARDPRRRDRAPPRGAEPGGVDGQRAQRGAADDRDRDQRDADLRRRERGDADERRADEAAEEVPERRPALRRPHPGDPPHQRTRRERDGERRDHRDEVVDGGRREGGVDPPAELPVHVRLHRDRGAGEHGEHERPRGRRDQRRRVGRGTGLGGCHPLSAARAGRRRCRARRCGRRAAAARTR